MEKEMTTKAGAKALNTFRDKSMESIDKSNRKEKRENLLASLLFIPIILLNIAATVYYGTSGSEKFLLSVALTFSMITIYIQILLINSLVNSMNTIVEMSNIQKQVILDMLEDMEKEREDAKTK